MALLRHRRVIGPSFPYVATPPGSGTTPWTPTNLAITPRLALDARNAVWGGSNLVSINCTGIEAGAMGVNGTPVKGTASNGISPISVSAATQWLNKTISWGISGKASIFWLGKLDSIVTNGLMNWKWNVFPTTTDNMVFYAAVSGFGAAWFGNRDYPGPVDSPPSWSTATNTMVPDTTGYHSLYAQIGSTNVSYADGANVVRDGSLADQTGAVPNYNNATPFEFFRGDGQNINESLQGSTFFFYLWDDFISLSDYQKLEGYCRWAINQVSELPIGNPYKSAPPTFP